MGEASHSISRGVGHIGRIMSNGVDEDERHAIQLDNWITWEHEEKAEVP